MKKIKSTFKYVFCLLFCYFVSVSTVSAKAEDPTCKTLLGETTAGLINQAYNIMKYIAVVLLFVLCMMDFIKAVASQDNDLLKKATTTAGKRIALGVIIFLVPTIVRLLLSIAGFSYDGCGFTN